MNIVGFTPLDKHHSYFKLVSLKIRLYLELLLRDNHLKLLRSIKLNSNFRHCLRSF